MPKGLSRLADATIFAEAVARGIGWPDNLLFDAVMASEQDAQTEGVDHDPLVRAMITVCKRCGRTWEGSMSDLLEACKDTLPWRRPVGVNRMSPRALSAALSRLDKNALAILGLEITNPKKRIVRLEWHGEAEEATSPTKSFPWSQRARAPREFVAAGRALAMTVDRKPTPDEI